MKSSLGTFTLFVVCISLTPAPAAEFIQLGYLPGHEWSWAFGVSDDGIFVAGTSGTSSCRGVSQRRGISLVGCNGHGWTGNAPGSERSVVSGISGDGSTVVGTSVFASDGSQRGTAFVYDAAHGLRDISTGQPLTEVETTADIVSIDGAYVVGKMSHFDAITGARNPGALPLVRSGRTQWGSVTLVTTTKPIATDMSPDGSIIVGDSRRVTRASDGSALEASEFEIFKWTEGTGMVATGVPSSGRTTLKVSADGSIISGSRSISSGFRSQRPRGLLLD